MIYSEALTGCVEAGSADVLDCVKSDAPVAAFREAKDAPADVRNGVESAVVLSAAACMDLGRPPLYGACCICICKPRYWVTPG